MKHNEIAYSNFSISTLLGLSSRGIFVLGIQAIHDFSQPLGYLPSCTGYIVSDNETGKVWTADQVIEAARAPYLSGIADDLEEAESYSLSLASELKDFTRAIAGEATQRREGKETIQPALLKDYRDTIAGLVMGAYFLVDMVERVEKDFLSLYPEEEKQEGSR
jgi:hypothetical protein